MPKFQFTGDYGANVQLPDGSVLLVQPGDVVDLSFNEPGPLWKSTSASLTPATAAEKKAAASAKRQATIAAKTAAKVTAALVTAPTPVAPTTEEIKS